MTDHFKVFLLDPPGHLKARTIAVATTPHQIVANTDSVEKTNAWVIYNHAIENWLTVSKYASKFAVLHEEDLDEHTGSGNRIMTFDDGSQLWFRISR